MRQNTKKGLRLEKPKLDEPIPSAPLRINTFSYYIFIENTNVGGFCVKQCEANMAKVHRSVIQHFSVQNQKARTHLNEEFANQKVHLVIELNADRNADSSESFMANHPSPSFGVENGGAAILLRRALNI